MPKREHGLGSEEHGKIVREGYNRIAKEYYTERDLFKNEEEIQEFISFLPEKGVVLDIGCGGGVPVLRTLVDNGFEAKGIDFSQGMLDLAKENVPEAELILGDITKTDFEPESFDGIISTYAFIHIFRTEHPRLYGKIFTWLKPGGVMLVGTARTEWEEISDFFGVPMAWSHPDARESLQLVNNTGFEVLFERLVTTGDETAYWILAKKPES
ncbi:MAG: class I SAM-dependent methyltransferase [Candidatus Thorarchaeota archaeon]